MEIQEAREADIESLKHKDLDETRVQNPNWLVVLKVCHYCTAKSKLPPKLCIENPYSTPFEKNCKRRTPC